MNCKNCEQKNAVKYSQYSTGEFCCKECARAYSTKNKRQEINKKVSKTLKNRIVSPEKVVRLFGDKNGRYNKNISKEEREIRKNKPPRIKKEDVTNLCKSCNRNFIVPYKQRKQVCCSKSCSMKERHKTIDNNPDYLKRCSEWGKKSSESQNKRSKNEIYFGELCKEKFKTVKFNESMFNGWDADVIIEDLKVAILWNGKWHYEKITKLHSVKQVQNRDKIKIKEILNSGYVPYIIKDMGKQNKIFVEKEFKKFIDNIR
jgi:hypothetical protein